MYNIQWVNNSFLVFAIFGVMTLCSLVYGYVPSFWGMNCLHQQSRLATWLGFVEFVVLILLMMRHGSLTLYPVIGSPVAFSECLFTLLTCLLIYLII